MANELLYSATAPGVTAVKARIKVGATRWNATSYVASSTIADNAWTTGLIAMTELLTASGTPTGDWVGDMPAGHVSGVVTANIDFYENAAPTPQTRKDGQQSFWWDGTDVILPPVDWAVRLAANGLDLISMTPAAGLPTTFREWLVAMIRRVMMVGGRKKTSSALQDLADDGTTVLVQNAYTVNGANETTGPLQVPT